MNNNNKLAYKIGCVHMFSSPEFGLMMFTIASFGYAPCGSTYLCNVHRNCNERFPVVIKLGNYLMHSDEIWCYGSVFNV
jgi:hypothetical protein